MKVAECPENTEITKTENDATDNVKDKIMSILGALIFILMIIFFAEIIYYDVPIVGPVGP